MRILVTGGAGFIGATLCERLHRDGHHVVCLDDFSTGLAGNVEHLASRPGFELVEHDVTRPLPPGLDVERIFHLACPASPRRYMARPLATFETAVVGTLNVLRLAIATDARVLLASTSEVYGDPEVHPQPETYWGRVNPIGPRACYDEGKRAAETVCFDAWREHGLEIRVVRIFNTYGPRMRWDDGRVVSSFIGQALRGEDLTVFGDGEQTRSFCYVDDLVDGIVRMMDQASHLGPVNLGNPEECTIKQLAELVLELTGSRSQLVRRPLPLDDPARREPDITLARELLRWEPKVTLRDGLERSIAFARDRLRPS